MDHWSASKIVGKILASEHTYIEYARFADDLVILIDAYKRHDWLVGAVDKRLREEFGKLQVEINGKGRTRKHDQLVGVVCAHRRRAGEWR